MLYIPKRDATLCFELVGGRLDGRIIESDPARQEERELFEMLARETSDGLQGERVWVPFPDRTAVDEYVVDHRQRTGDDRVIARCYFSQTLSLPLPR
jgi:hypothetical protein